MSLSSRPWRERAVALLAAALTSWLVLGVAAAGASAGNLDVLAVAPAGPDHRVAVVADVRPPPAAPIPAKSFSVSAAGEDLPTDAVPLLSDRLSVGLVIDTAVAAPVAAPGALQEGLSGAASFLLQMPPAARAAVLTDGSPPAVVARLATGAADAVRALDAVRPQSGRNTSEALTMALNELPADTRDPQLVLLYTGASDAAGQSAAELTARLLRAHAVLAVVTAGTARTAYWAQVAHGTGGVQVAARPRAPLAAFDDVARALRGRYLVSFPAPGVLPTLVSVQVDTPAGTLTAEARIAATAAGAVTSGGGRGWVLVLVLGAGAVALASAVALVTWAVLVRRKRPADRGAATPLWSRQPRLPSLARRSPSPAVAGTPAPENALPRAVPLPSPSRADANVHPHPTAPPPEPEPASVREAPASAGLDRGAAMLVAGGVDPGAIAGREPDAAYGRLDAELGEAAAEVERGELDRLRAVARVALAAGGRADLLDRATDTERRMAGSPFGDWPPTATVLDLLAGAREIATGHGALVAPDGTRVEHAEPGAAEGNGGGMFRLTRHDHTIRHCRTVDELAEHVDLSTLAAESDR